MIHSATVDLHFVAAESSMGFRAPAEAARILAESIDHSHKGELVAARPGQIQPQPRATDARSAPAQFLRRASTGTQRFRRLVFRTGPAPLAPPLLLSGP